MKDFIKKTSVAFITGVLLSSSVMPINVAFADNSASVGEQAGSGQTDLTMVMENTGEYGGTSESEFLEDGITPNPRYNPDANNDDLGDNLAFTVPSAINYVVRANGMLVGPSEGVAYIENKSTFTAHVSSMDIDPETGFNFVSDASTSDAANSVDLQIGPATDMLQASNYLTKADVTNTSSWNMSADGNSNLSKVLLKSAGDVSHIDKDITSQTRFGKIKWYVTPGQARGKVTVNYTIGSDIVDTEFSGSVVLDVPPSGMIVNSLISTPEATAAYNNLRTEVLNRIPGTFDAFVDFTINIDGDEYMSNIWESIGEYDFVTDEISYIDLNSLAGKTISIRGNMMVMN